MRAGLPPERRGIHTPARGHPQLLLLRALVRVTEERGAFHRPRRHVREDRLSGEVRSFHQTLSL